MIGKLKIGIMISGRGSNMRALVGACRDEMFPAEVRCVIGNTAKSEEALEYARECGIPTLRASDYDVIHNALVENCVALICLAGFMRILPSSFIARWPDKIINIHPSLLPSFRGLHAQAQALNAGVKISGCTVHYVVPEIDAGAIIAQHHVFVRDNDTVESLSDRILQIEHDCYITAVKKIAESWPH